MAIQVNNFQSRTGLTIPAAYVRVYQININLAQKTIDVFISIHADDKARSMNLNPIEYDQFVIYTDEFDKHFNMQLQKNVLTQAYGYLKKLDKFVNSLDV